MSNARNKANVVPVLGTSQATTSGLTKDFTGIPSWVKKITIVFNGVSLTGSSNSLVQLGSGSFVTTGYSACTGYIATTNQCSISSATNGLCVTGGTNANAFTGTMTLIHTGGNVWVASHSGNIGSTYVVNGGGSISLSGALDRIRLTTANGTDTFDAGSVNILYE